MSSESSGFAILMKHIDLGNADEETLFKMFWRIANLAIMRQYPKELLECLLESDPTSKSVHMLELFRLL